jgi:thioredoxin 2
LDKKLKVSCQNCGTTNFYPGETRGKKVVCGKCKEILPEPGRIVSPSPGQIYNLIQNSALPVLVDFFSPTCMPCQVMHPVLENLAMRRAGELMVVRINVAEHPEMSAAFGIQGVPTFVIIRKGNERGRTSGAADETQFALWVASLA